MSTQSVRWTSPGRLRAVVTSVSGVLICAAGLSMACHGAEVASPDLDIANMDLSVKPGDDFFEFANGTWLKQAQIPADRSRWGVIAELRELNQQRTADLIKEVSAKGGRLSPEERKIADYYSSFMDEAAIEKRGYAPVRPMLARIKAIRDRKQLAHWLGSTVRADVDVLNATNVETDNILGLWVAQDLDNPARYLPFLLQGGLSMPDRDYYISTSKSMAEIRPQFLQHIETVFKSAGFPDPHASAARVYALEMRIAAVHATREESVDVAKGNNHWQRADFEARAPGMDWQQFFAASGLAKQPEFVVWHPGAVKGIAALAGSASRTTGAAT